MRIVHVVTAFPRHEGDPITPWLVELVRRQRAAGFQATVLAPAFRGGPDTEPSPVPVRRFRYAPASLETLTHDQAAPDRIRGRPAYAALLPGYLAGGVAAALSLGRERPEVAHVHWPMPHAVFGAAMRWGSGGHTAVVCSYYSVEINWVLRRMPWLRGALRWTARTADAVTAISTSTARAVQELVERPVAVIPYAAALPEGAGGPSRPPLSDPDSPLRILFVGRLVERKGVDVLVRALARVRESREAELLVIGAGERETSIRRTAKEAAVSDAVHMAGFVSEERLVREYAACDVFVLPAVVDARGDTEGLGVVLLEAMLHARPVIASNAGGIPDIVQHGHTGWLVPPGDPEALARRLLEVAGQPEMARRVAEQGREHARTRFSWARILAETERVYREALETLRERRG